MEMQLYGTNDEQNISASASQSSPKKRQRGPTTGKKYRTKEPKFIEWNDNGKPIGKWAKSYKAYLGDTARTKIDINIKSWDTVSTGLKNTIWEDIRNEFHIDDKMKGHVLKNVNGRWKDFNARLVSGWIAKTRKLSDDHREPYEFYDGVTKTQWETFKKNCETEEFKQISEKARKSQAYNEHPQFLGQSGYAGKKAKWITEGHSSSTTLPSGPVLDRSVDWILARSKKGVDGNYTIPNDKTKIVADKVNDWREKAVEGAWVPDRHDDFLNRALGKKEHSGRVRGIGGTVGIKNVFGEVEKRKGLSGVISADELHLITQEIEAKVSQKSAEELHHITQEIEAKMRQKLREEMDVMVAEKVATILNKMGMPNDKEVNNTPSTEHRSSCQSTHPSKLQATNKIQGTDPYADLQKPTKCRLALNLDSAIVLVGHGMVHPASRPGDQSHSQPILADHVKVGIDAVEPSHEARSLPVPTKHHSTIGEAIGSFVQWPKSLVLLRDNATATLIASNNKVEECIAKDLFENRIENVMNRPTKRKPIVDEETCKTLTGECRYFHDLIMQTPSDDDVINAIQVDKDLFMYDEGFEINIPMDDIIQFFSMAWLNASWLQIYIMWLNHMCIDLKVETIGFMCPQKLSQVRKHPDATNTYLSNTWRALYSKSLLLAPHYEGAFKIYKALGGKCRGSTLRWKHVKCPQQSGVTDCVYYVMRYMHDIVKNHNQSIDLQKDFIQHGSYNQEEIDEVQDNLASYIMHNLM